MTSDPSLHWDGRQWHRWNGQARKPQGTNAGAVAVPTEYGPTGPNPKVSARYPAGVAPYRPHAMDDSTAKPVETTIAWIITVLTLGYMLPWAFAATRGKSNSAAIGLLNFFVGWTLIGWIAAGPRWPAADPNYPNTNYPNQVQANPNYPHPNYAPPSDPCRPGY